ncbi:DUF6870 family protein [Anaerosporobacter sp.]
MLLPEEWEKMSQVDVATVNPDDLVDIREVQIDNSLTDEEKIMDYIEKIKNPYVFKYGKYIIKLEFNNESGVTLEEVLEELVRKVAEGMSF